MNKKNLYNPCFKILKREIKHENDLWQDIMQ